MVATLYQPASLIPDQIGRMHVVMHVVKQADNVSIIPKHFSLLSNVNS